MSDHNKCPSSKKEHEKCIYRKSYFHRIQPSNQSCNHGQHSQPAIASDDCITGTRWRRVVWAKSPGTGPPIIHLSSSSSGVWQRHSFTQSTPHCPVPTEAALGHVGRIHDKRIIDFISNKLSRYDLNQFRRGIKVAVAWLHTTISSVHDSGPAGSD